MTTVEYSGFSIDRLKLENMVLGVYTAALLKRSLFSQGHQHFVPQFNLPEELEYSPTRVETPDSLLTSQYLFTHVFFERRTASDEITLNAHSTWYDPNTRWFFDPHKVIQAPEGAVEQVSRSKFKYGLDDPEKDIRYNAQLLVDKYQGDPRQIADQVTVEEARKRLMEFSGFGTGISNLFIHYGIARKFAMPSDIQNALLKVDIHKGRLPINMGAVIPTNQTEDRSEVSRSDAYINAMEHEYWRVSQKYGLDPCVLDDILWILGSNGCTQQDMRSCQHICPVVESCVQCVRENPETGKYELRIDGKTIDTRQNKGQGSLFPLQ